MAIAAAFTTIPVASSSLRLRAAKQQVVNSWSGGRRALVVGSSSGLFVGAAVAAGAVAVVAAARAMATDNGHEAVLATRRGMQLFGQGDVKGSVVEFDKALELDPRQRPYLWQRGLSLYYLNRFEEGAKQFRDDVDVNPNDTEESIWCFLCEAQLHGPEEARKRFLEVGRDSRPVMRAAYELFRDGGDSKELLSLASSNVHDFFYAYLYVALYHESKGETEAAKDAMVAAVSSPYGARSGDYMATLAKVHCACRGWPVKEPLNVVL
jgi:tetratricopeptide (TPR) repeat protein